VGNVRSSYASPTLAHGPTLARLGASQLGHFGCDAAADAREASAHRASYAIRRSSFRDWRGCLSDAGLGGLLRADRE